MAFCFQRLSVDSGPLPLYSLSLLDLTSGGSPPRSPSNSPAPIAPGTPRLELALSAAEFCGARRGQGEGQASERERRERRSEEPFFFVVVAASSSIFHCNFTGNWALFLLNSIPQDGGAHQVVSYFGRVKS